MLCTWMIDMVFSLVCAQMMLLAGAATFTPVPWVRIRYRQLLRRREGAACPYCELRVIVRPEISAVVVDV